MALSLTPQQIVDKDEYDLLKIAESWLRVPLQTVATVQNGFAFKSEFFDRTEGMPLIRIRDVTKEDTEHRYRGEYLEEYVVRNGEILLGMDGDFKAAKWQGRDALLNQRVCRLVVTSDFYDREFFFLCLQPYLNAINAETSSVTVKHLSSRSVQDIPLPLPPLDEQRRIVEKIENLFAELDKGEESLEAAKARAGLYRQSLLKHAFEGHLTADWRTANPDKLEDPESLLTRIQDERDARYKQALDDWQVALEKWRNDDEEGKKPAKPKRPKDAIEASKAELSKMPELPRDWAYAPLVNLFNIVSGGTPKGIENCVGEKYPFYKISDMNTEGNERLMSLANINVSEQELGRLNLTAYPSGTVIFPKRGGAILTNKKRQLSKPSCFDLNTMGVFSDINSLKPDYLWLWFAALDLGNIYDGSNVPQINNKNVEPLLFPVCSIAEQAKIVDELEAKLSTLDAVEKQLEEQLKRSKALRQSILKRAFSGELVDQDPNDEPASELLDRIKAEKVEAELAAKRDNKAKPVRKPKNRRLTMSDLIEVLKKEGDWVPASKAAQGLGIADGTSSDDVEAFYRQLKDRIETNEIEVERRGDEDWLRLAKVEAT